MCRVYFKRRKKRNEKFTTSQEVAGEEEEEEEETCAKNEIMIRELLFQKRGLSHSANRMKCAHSSVLRLRLLLVASTRKNFAEATRARTFNVDLRGGRNSRKH